MESVNAVKKTKRVKDRVDGFIQFPKKMMRILTQKKLKSNEFYLDEIGLLNILQ